MKVNIGSKNKSKVASLTEILKEYPDFSSAEVVACDAISDVSHQPKSLAETIAGAKARAKNCFKECEYSVGLESGLMEVPETKTGYMDVTACAIYDGKTFHLGLSSAFEYPVEVTKYALKNNAEFSDAFRDLGFTNEKKIGEGDGIIAFLTKGRLVRKEYTKQAITTALIHLENKELY